MLKFIFIIIILYIVLRELYNCYKPANNDSSINNNKDSVEYNKDRVEYNKENKFFGDKYIPNDPRILSLANQAPVPSQVAKKQGELNNIPKKISEPTYTEFDNPNPWTRLDVNNNDEFPFKYYIKINFSSLNDYQNWKQLVPNLDFSPKTGELIIPSKNEGSALALANLVLAQIHDQLSLQDIVNKKLIQISVAKAQEHELVRTKLREQILSTMNAKPVVKTSNYEEDLATPKQKSSKKVEPEPVNNVESFNDKKIDLNSKDIEAFDGNDFSYI